MEINTLNNMHPAIYSHLRKFYLRLTNRYDDRYPDDRHSIRDYKRYFGQAKLIEILELAFEREIGFTLAYPLEDDKYAIENICGDIEAFDVKYLGDPRELDPRQLLVKKFYDLAIPYAIKFEYDEHPIMFRDIIGIEKTISLLEEADNRFIQMICNLPEGKKDITSGDLEFVILEDNEWYDEEEGKVKKDSDME